MVLPKAGISCNKRRPQGIIIRNQSGCCLRCHCHPFPACRCSTSCSSTVVVNRWLPPVRHLLSVVVDRTWTRSMAPSSDVLLLLKTLNPPTTTSLLKLLYPIGDEKWTRALDACC